MRHRRPLLVLPFAIATAACALASHPPALPRPGADEPYGRFRARRNRAGDYLTPIEVLLDTALSPGVSGRPTMIAWQWSKLGNYERAARADEDYDGNDEPYALESSEQALVAAIDPQPAVSGLCAAAHGRRLVIVNEEHPYPVDRAFGADVLPCLRADGFDSLAMEMLDDDTSPVRADGVPRDYHGNFVDEPRMSDLFAEGAALGFRLVPYEHSSSAPDPKDRWNEREQGQADRLAAFLRENPNARLVVWCGYDHAHEHDRSTDPRDRPMAERLEEATGIDALTVAQIAGRLRDDDAGPLFVAVNRHRASPGPLFVELASCWSRIPRSFVEDLTSADPGTPPFVDAVVIHESRHAGDARHLWLERPAAEAHPARVACSARRHPLGMLVQLFRDAAAAERDVPYDQALCPCDRDCELVAPPGRWFVVVRDEWAPSLSTFVTLGAEPVVFRADR